MRRSDSGISLLSASICSARFGADFGEVNWSSCNAMRLSITFVIVTDGGAGDMPMPGQVAESAVSANVAPISSDEPHRSIGTDETHWCILCTTVERFVHASRAHNLRKLRRLVAQRGSPRRKNCTKLAGASGAPQPRYRTNA